MTEKLYMRILGLQAGIFATLLAKDAHALGGGNSFGSIARNITDAVESLPGLLTSLIYLVGLLLAVLGIMKIKDHVENPTQTPMKEGAVRLLTGGALFALPILMEAMLNAIGTTGVLVEAQYLNKAGFNVC